MRNRRTWALEGWTKGSVTPWRVAVSRLPFRIGRRHDLELALGSSLVSKLHAQIVPGEDGLLLEDLGSTNGTMLNLEPVNEPSQLHAGDLLHFADREFRLIAFDDESGISTVVADMSSYQTLERAAPLFRQLLDERNYYSLFQPIVPRDGNAIGYELLSRGDQEGLPSGPAELFEVAETLKLETQLVTDLRLQGLEAAVDLPGNPLILINTHPKEIDQPESLLVGLARAREQQRSARLVLEIHENTVTDFESFSVLRAGLTNLDIQLAFDDFGAGRARFLELAELSPHFVKFDRRLIHRLESASPKRLELIRGLVRTVADMDIETIAEGIETPEEAEICWDLGFDFAQGFYFGRPMSVEEVREADESQQPPPEA